MAPSNQSGDTSASRVVVGLLAFVVVCAIGACLAYLIPRPDPHTTTIDVWNPNSSSVLKTESPYPWDGLSDGAELLDFDEFKARAETFADTTTIIHIMDNDSRNAELFYTGRLPEEPYPRYYTRANITYAGWGLGIDGADLIGDKFIIRFGFDAFGGGFFLMYLACAIPTLAVAYAVVWLIIQSSRKPPMTAEERAGL